MAGLASRRLPSSARSVHGCERIVHRADTKSGGKVDGALTVAGIDAFEEVLAAGVVGVLDEVEAGAVEGNRIERGEDADVAHTGILGYGAAVAVHGEIAHDIDVRRSAREEIGDGACRIRHGCEEGILFTRVAPQSVLRFPGAAGVDPRLAVRRRAADRQLFQRAAVAAHRMALEVGQHEEGIVGEEIFADVILMQHLAVSHRKHRVRALCVEKIDREQLGPAVAFEQLPVLLRRVARAAVRRVALDHGAGHRVHHRLQEGRVQIVLVALLAGVYLHRHTPGQLDPQPPIQSDNGFRRKGACEIYGRFGHILPPMDDVV